MKGRTKFFNYFIACIATRSLWRLSQRAATMIRRLRPANWC
ncbi:hypothetical protein [Alistipes putredinis]